jgi:separase
MPGPASPVPRKSPMGRIYLDSMELRVAQGLLDTLFALCDAYFVRGSAREAEHFSQQAHDFAESLNALALVGRALARKGEVKLYQGQLQEGNTSIMQAAEVLQNVPSTDGADVSRLRGDYSQLCAQPKCAQELYAEATVMIEELDKHFGAFDGLSSR